MPGHLEQAFTCGNRPLQIPSCLPCSPMSVPGRRTSHPDQCDEGSDQRQLWKRAGLDFQCDQHLHLLALYQQGGNIQVEITQVHNVLPFLEY